MNENNLMKENQTLKQEVYRLKCEVEELKAKNEKLEIFYLEYSTSPLFDDTTPPKHL